MSERWQIVRVYDEADDDAPHPAGFVQAIAYGMTASDARLACQALNHWERHADWHYTYEPAKQRDGAGGAER